MSKKERIRDEEDLMEEKKVKRKEIHLKNFFQGAKLRWG